MVKINLKDKLKQVRKSEGLTQSQLGEKLMISGDYISKIESGKRDPSPIVGEKIVEYLSKISGEDNNSSLIINGHSAHIDVHHGKGELLPADIQVVVDIMFKMDMRNRMKIYQYGVELTEGG